MNKRNKEFFEKRKQMKLQAAWDLISDFIIETSTGGHTHFAGAVQTGHFGHVVLYTAPNNNKLISTKNYKRHLNF